MTNKTSEINLQPALIGKIVHCFFVNVVLRHHSCSILSFVLDVNVIKHVMTGPEGNSEISMFPETKSRPETLRFKGNKIHCFPRDQSLRDLLYSKTKQKKANFEKRAEIPATTSGHLQLHALITCNSGQHFAGNSELFPV